MRAALVLACLTPKCLVLKLAVVPFDLSQCVAPQSNLIDIVSLTSGRLTSLDTRGRSPHVRASSPPIVRRRSRGSLPRFPFCKPLSIGVLGLKTMGVII